MIDKINRWKLLASAALLIAGTGLAQAQTLRIGLQDDPDALDPAKARTFVGRIVFTAMCDKLVDIDDKLNFVPQLATSWTYSEDGKTLSMKLRSGVKFQDGTPFDANAVKFNIERSQTLNGSMRKSELASVESVSVDGPLAVSFHLKSPDSTLLAQFTDRSGMMVSPKAATELGDNFAQKPVCSGPYKFVERVAQDRIVLEKFEDYWNKDAYKIQKVVYLPIPDTTVRLANLRSGDLQLIERLAAPDVKTVKADPTLQYATDPGIGYQALYINVANGDRAKTPLGQDKRVRQALELALDRDAINQVVFEGVNPPANQPFGVTSPWYDKDFPLKPRNVAKAKELLKAAGVTGRLKVEIMVATSTLEQQVTQLIQAMWAEIGVDVSIRATEFATLLKEASTGNFEIAQFGWSGRPDPDGNIHTFVTCKGGLNYPKYCNAEVDKQLFGARAVVDPAKRKVMYDAAQKILLDDMPVIYTYQQSWNWAYAKTLKGFKPYPDGMIRLAGVTLQ
mgnify:CR=1 FL=1